MSLEWKHNRKRLIYLKVYLNGMYDKYDSPGDEQDSGQYNESQLGNAGEAIGGIVEQAKPYAPMIIGGIVALAVLFFAYDFFIGSYHPVQIELTDTEGKPIDGTIKLSNPQGQEIKTVKGGEAVNLKNGPYKADVSSAGKKTLRQYPLTISGTGPVAIEMEAAKQLELKGEIPDSFVTGEQKDITLTITNRGNQDEDVKLLLEGDMKGAMKLEYGEPLLIAPGENVVNAKLKVDREVESKLRGENKSGAIRIEGLSNKDARIGAEYSLTQFSTDKFRVTFAGSLDKAQYGKVKAGESVEKILKVSNDNVFDFRNAKAEVKISSTQFSTPSDVEKWFRFSPENFISVPAGEEGQMTVVLTVPASMQFPQGKETESITGALYLRTSYYEKKFDIMIDAAKIDAKILIDGINEKYTLQRRDNAYKKEVGMLDIRNGGEVLLTDIEARIDCKPQDSAWLTFSGATDYAIDSLEKGQRKGIAYIIDLPSTTPAARIASCTITVVYKDPSGQRRSNEKQVILMTE